MTGTARAMLTRYGTEMTRTRNGEILRFRGFLQQTAPAGGQSAPTSLGASDPRRWQLLSPEEILPGDGIASGKARFRAEDCRPVCAGAEVCHWQAVLRREGDDA